MRRVAHCDQPVWSDGADVLRLRALRALRGVELDPLVLVEALVAAAGDGGVVDEHVLAAVIGSDEAEALFAVEPLHSSLCHSLALLQWSRTCRRTPCAR